jgi:hypothetical protein
MLIEVGFPWCTALKATEVQHTTFLFPGTPAEAQAVVGGAESSADKTKGERTAVAGKGWAYRATLLSTTARCVLAFKAQGSPVVTVTDVDGKPILSRSEKTAHQGSTRIQIASPQPLPSELRFHFRAAAAPITVRDVQFTTWLPDRNGDGLSDSVEAAMGLSSSEHPTIVPRPPIPHTGFFFSQPYDATMAVPTDAVQLYGGTVSPDPIVFSSWAEKGFGVQGFLHSRYPDAEGQESPTAYQTDRNGRPLLVIDVKHAGKSVDLAIGPITPELQANMIKQHGEGTTVEAMDHYKVPTQARIEQAKRCTAGALSGGAQAICFDEPEIWADAGYSEAFKQEWQAKYGTPWQPPHSSVDARYRAEQLKAFLLQRWVKSTLEDVEQHNSSAARMLALHSPINYYGMGMSTPHHRLIAGPAVQEVVAEVWNDPFELSYLEYSSFYHLVRGTNKRLWFMMDPWGDSPAMSLDFYRHSYGNNLLAALMFPQIDTYQPLIWPNRLYGHVPKDYEVIMNTVTGALSEMWRYPNGKMESGSRGFATFIADSMAWQRADPSRSDFDGFDGLTLPLVQRGVPVEALSLDRAAEPGYLNDFKCLLVCYDFLKPTDAAQNRALAEWTQQGGTLLCFGGTDAYNAVADSCWKHAGYTTPLEHLFAQLGLKLGEAHVLSGKDQDVVVEVANDALRTGPADLHIPLHQQPTDEKDRRANIVTLSESATDKTVRHYSVTLYTPPTGAVALYQVKGEQLPIAWESNVGKGRLIFVGVAPSYFKQARNGPAWLRALARYAFENAGNTYLEQPYYILHRGPYTAIRTLDKPYQAAGRFVDLLSPTLAMLDQPVIPPEECAFLSDATQKQTSPHLLATSGRLRAFHETRDKTSFLVQAPTQTDGVARIACGDHHVKDAKAFTFLGAPVMVNSRQEGDTLLLSYANDADGVIVRIEWELLKGEEQ